MMSLLGLIRQALRCTSGTAALEGAIVVPVAIVLMAGGVEFGQLFSAYGTAEKSMRDAARYLARVPTSDLSGNPTVAYICGWGLDDAKNLAMYGKTDPSDTDQPLIPGWTDPTTIKLNGITCPGGALPSPTIIDLQALIPYSGFMFSVVGLSNTWTLNVQHQEPSIGE